MTAATTPGRPAAHARPPRARRGGGVVYGVIGVLGELLITVGVLLLGFLVWQLWWTDVEGDAAQAQIVRDLGYVAPTPATSQDDGVADPSTEDPPVLAEPEHAVSFATLTVPRWEGEPARPISQGTDRPTVLDVLGIGHYEGTAMPGGVGNFALAGHRVTFGKPFNRIEELQVGDPLVVWTPDAWYVYRVTSSEVVMPADVRVIEPVPNEPGVEPTERYITLTTCHPMFSARERYIVHGVLDYWAPTSSGTPAELLG
ncbi:MULTISPECIES: class E sortase [Cellulomonas]|uniref:Sortase A n=1 Tax=Cellulomonas iranensis TaxID=76862 RepID=A0ABU0GK56_9CELL|nr:MULTISPECIES: class E sortase [Cellulomonas]MDQ0425304.1 sortase A [Cellulomonas iranensis]TFH71160.1 class E sortase [Cellulomonas sp. HD19AZ1]